MENRIIVFNTFSIFSIRLVGRDEQPAEASKTFGWHHWNIFFTITVYTRWKEDDKKANLFALRHGFSKNVYLV